MIIYLWRERQMFYKVVIYKDYDGSNKLGRIPSSKESK